MLTWKQKKTYVVHLYNVHCIYELMIRGAWMVYHTLHTHTSTCNNNVLSFASNPWHKVMIDFTSFWKITLHYIFNFIWCHSSGHKNGNINNKKRWNKNMCIDMGGFCLPKKKLLLTWWTISPPLTPNSRVIFIVEEHKSKSNW